MQGLMVRGVFRRLSTFRVKPEEGAPYDQLVAVVLDDDNDQMMKITCPREEERRFRDAFAGLEGSEVTVGVSLGSYKKLWFRELVRDA